MSLYLAKVKQGVFTLNSIDVPDPSLGMIRVKNTYASLSRYDVECMNGIRKFHCKSGVYGTCSVGVVESCGLKTNSFSKGDRVLYFSHNFGAHAEIMNVKESALIKINYNTPDNIICASFLNVLTSYYLLFSVFRVRKGQKIAITGLSGSMGSVLAQIAASLGIQVFGFTRSKNHVHINIEEFCSDIVEYHAKDSLARVLADTKLSGFDVLYDTVGKSSSSLYLLILGIMGTCVQFGSVTGFIEDISLNAMQWKSLNYVSPSYHCYISTRIAFIMQASNALLAISKGLVKIPCVSEVPFKEVPRLMKQLKEKDRLGFQVIKF